jgi:hypothetical protein
MKTIALFILTLFTINVYSQNSLNNYKYVFLPERFDFFKSNDQYGLNSLAKLLLEDKGFTVIMGNADLPPQVAANKCNALNTELTEKKGFFVTSLTFVLKDCQGNVLFKSKEGKSREKEWPAAYTEALQDAFSSLKAVPYKYDSTAMVAQVPVTATATAPAAIPAAPAAQKPAAAAIAIENIGTLYAQPTDNGFQLVDTTPQKILTLLKTSQPDYYIAEGASNGVVFKKNEEWLFEYYKDNKLMSQKLQIKF